MAINCHEINLFIYLSFYRFLHLSIYFSIYFFATIPGLYTFEHKYLRNEINLPCNLAYGPTYGPLRIYGSTGRAYGPMGVRTYGPGIPQATIIDKL
jgi:hypothetical protein